MKPAPENEKPRFSGAIRPARLDDLDDIEKLEKKSFGDQAWPRDIIEAYLQASIDDPAQVPLLVAFAKAANGSEAFAGYTIGCRGGKDRGMVLDLVVAAEFKGLHLGRELLRRVSESLKEAGAADLTLEVEATNKAAIRLYESVGFIKDHVMPDYYGAARDAWWMVNKAKFPRP